MRFVTSMLRRRTEVLASLVVLLGMLVFPSSAHAQWFQFNDEGASYAVFGPNSSVTLNMGQFVPGNCDPFFPATNVFVVNTGSIGDGALLTDVSNGQGLPNTIIGASGGLFIDETIAFTAPGGFLGPGTYGIVFDECQDGHFNAGTDTLFYPAFEVVIPANVPILPSAGIAAIKAAAAAEGSSWSRLVQVVDAIEAAIEIKDALECISGGIAGCIVSTAVSALEDMAKETAMGILGLTDPKDVARDAVMDEIGHYGGIAADPPDPNFQQLSPLGPTAPIATQSDNPLESPLIAIGNASRTEDELLAALLHSIERYQGADDGDSSDWALVHARAIKAYSADLVANIPATNAALQTLSNALTADTHNLDAAIANLSTIRGQFVTSGFDDASTQGLMNLGATASQLTSLRAFLNAKPPLSFTEADAQTRIADIVATNVQIVSALNALSSGMDDVITTLTSAPNLPSGRPIANAGGPYAGTEGVALSLNGSLSTDPIGTITSYAWDLDRDGQFDDATGATPSVTFPAAFSGMIGLQVTDNDGNTSIEYANITIAEANHAPSIVTFNPAASQQSVLAGASRAFNVTTSDPDGDSVSVRWLIDFVQVGTGSSFNYTPTLASLGTHTLRAEASDGQPGGGSTIHEWAVAVVAADGDGDGWGANVDCNDGNPAIHPLGPEIIGNGIDDDCNPATLDGGTPPTAGFSVVSSLVVVGQAVQFTDTSTDLDSPIVSWAWNFGDGQTSTAQNPTHTFATAGSFTVTLTVTDPQSFTSTASTVITATHLPTAAFGFTPNPGVRNSPVHFTDLSTDADGPIASRSWQFGDGGISTDANPVHTYSVAADYTVSLTVTDGSGATATLSQGVTVAPAATDVTALRFVLLETNCGAIAPYVFSIGGVQVATITPTYDCTCGPAEKSVTVTDPAIIELVTSPVCQVFDLESTTTTYVGWARVEIVRPQGTERVKIVDTNAGDGPDVYTQNVCSGYGSPRTFHSALPNLDGDGTPDCTDDDIDGDGVLNAADNCPIKANPGQADFNNDGTGDACQDTDGDTFLDAVDNCPALSNPNQFDFDHDGIGNACDTDIDADGVANAADNCPYLANPGQADADGDGHGDVCDISQMQVLAERSLQGYQTTLRVFIDSTQVATIPYPAVADYNCSTAPTVVTITDPELLALLGVVPTCNAFRIVSDNYMLMSWSKAQLTHWGGTVDSVVINDQTGGSFQQYACYQWDYQGTYQNAVPDTDGDGIYNCEDPDIDSDGVLNAADNCPLVPNSNQADVDGNGTGDACQDTDHDTVLDINDNCPAVSNVNQANLDGDSLGDVCDPDMDNDTVLNGADNCPSNPNTDQADLDHDGLGDVCDSDLDGDNVANGSDNCLTTPNSDQINTDGDAFGDACDPDKDNDGVLNAADNCELRVNGGQEVTNPYGVGDVCVPIPITVPWLGVPTQPHQVYSGGSLILQGEAIYDGDFAPAPLTGATWDPGDGTGPVEVSVANPYAIELEHVYTGAPNTPYHATLRIRFGNNQSRTDEFRVLIQPRTIDVEANMAIDRGLWNLHKVQTRTTATGASGAIRASYWTGPDNVAATSATVQAFGINNHRVNGNRLEDPYVEDVRRGLPYLESQLTPFTTSVQPAGNPDTNGNGIAVSYGQYVYVTGQIADAFVGAGLQTTVATAGDATWIRGRNYRDIVQDIMDGYWFGQADIGGAGRGGWHYYFNYSSADNSTAQWGAITGLAGENAWNIPVPQWVKDENLNYWLKNSQDYTSGSAYFGSLGYSGPGWVWSNGMSTTPSGIVQMDFDGVRNDPNATTDNEMRFQAAVRYIARGMRNAWHVTEYGTGANYYSLFAMAKAFRLAVDTDGSGNQFADPVTLIDDVNGDASPPFDWYRNDPAIPSTDSPMGVARLLISRQAGGGNWPDAGYWGGSLGTAYAVIILSPTIFELGPAAMCSAVPTVAGTGDAVAFDGSGSVHNDPFGEIVSYTWDFQDGTAAQTNASPNASHAFGALGTYNVLLTVTDQNGITAAASCPVQIIAGNRPPLANAGGPYNFCVASPMVLNASASSDPEGGALTYAWDLAAPLNFSSVDGNTAVFDATSALTSLAPGTYQIGLRVTDDHSLTHSVFPNISIWPADNPTYCNTPPVLTVSPNLTTMATSAAGVVVSYTVSANDPQEGPLTPACTPQSNTTFPIGTTVVSCTVTDAHGLSDSGEFSVTVVNNAPTFTPPANITTAAVTASGAAVSFTAVGNDIEDGPITAVCTPASGATFPIATTTVNCIVTDSGHLTATGSFTVTVTGTANTPPSFTPPANIVTATTNPAGTAVSFTATGNDAQDGPIAAVCVPASGSNFPIATTTVNCTVTDSGGLTATGSFTVTVNLTNTPPTFTPPANITTPATSAAGATVNFTAVGNDAQDGAITAVCVPASGSTFAITTTTVNCTVTDSGGLTATGSFTVTVTPQAVSPVSVTGGAYFMHDGYQEKVQLDVAKSASGVITGGDSVKYYYTRTRMNLVSTQIQTVVLSGHTATLTGLATINGAGGFTFTLTITDGTPDAFGLTVRRADGSVYYSYSAAASSGDLIIH